MGMILIYKKYYYYLYFWNGTRSTRPTLAINRSIAKVGRVDFSFNLRIRHPCADGNENMGPPFGWVSNLLSLKLSWEGGAVTAVTMSHCFGEKFVGPCGPPAVACFACSQAARLNSTRKRLDEAPSNRTSNSAT